jgi:hypothetical protein
VHAFDAREGSSFRISLTYDEPTETGKTTAHTDTFHGRFVKLIPNERVVEVVEFETPIPIQSEVPPFDVRLQPCQHIVPPSGDDLEMPLGVGKTIGVDSPDVLTAAALPVDDPSRREHTQMLRHPLPGRLKVIGKHGDRSGPPSGQTLEENQSCRVAERRE